MFDYKLIEAIAVVVQEGGFEKAAAKLCLTQSAISQRVRQLEEQAGQILLTRTMPPAVTEAGQWFLAHYLQVRHLEADLAGRTSLSPGDQPVTLTVGGQCGQSGHMVSQGSGPHAGRRQTIAGYPGRRPGADP